MAHQPKPPKVYEALAIARELRRVREAPRETPSPMRPVQRPQRVTTEQVLNGEIYR